MTNDRTNLVADRGVGLLALALLIGWTTLALGLAQAPPLAPLTNINPSWSPDGSQLVFESRRDGRAQLYIINADGTGERRLTANGADDTHPAWSPDGSTIVFGSTRDGDWEIYTIIHGVDEGSVRLLRLQRRFGCGCIRDRTMSALTLAGNASAT